VSGYGNTIEAMAWFQAYVIEGCNTEPRPADWDVYVYNATALYAIAHGADAEAIQQGDIDPDTFTPALSEKDQA
jgi:hypothetical protein